MLRIAFLVVIGVLCVGLSALRAEEAAGGAAEARIKALETEVAVLKRALGTFQAGVGKRQAEGAIRQDLNNVRMLSALLMLSGPRGPKAGADGRIDVYRLVRRGEISEEDFDVFESLRSGLRPTNAEIKQGDYTYFAFGRFKGKVERGKDVPLLWQRYAHADGKRFVGYSSGAARGISEAQFQAQMKEHGQDP